MKITKERTLHCAKKKKKKSPAKVVQKIISAFSMPTYAKLFVDRFESVSNF